MAKSKNTRKRKKKMVIIEDIENLSKIINKVQLNEKKQTFRVRNMDFIPTIENIIKDSSLIFKKKQKKNYCIFYLHIGKQKFNEEIDVDNIKDIDDLLL